MLGMAESNRVMPVLDACEANRNVANGMAEE